MPGATNPAFTHVSPSCETGSRRRRGSEDATRGRAGEGDDQGVEGSDAGVLKNNGNIRVLKQSWGWVSARVDDVLWRESPAPRRPKDSQERLQALYLVISSPSSLVFLSLTIRPCPLLLCAVSKGVGYLGLISPSIKLRLFHLFHSHLRFSCLHFPEYHSGITFFFV